METKLVEDVKSRVAEKVGQDLKCKGLSFFELARDVEALLLSQQEQANALVNSYFNGSEPLTLGNGIATLPIILRAEQALRDLIALRELKYEAWEEIPISVGRIGRTAKKLEAICDAYKLFDEMKTTIASTLEKKFLLDCGEERYLKAAGALIALAMWEKDRTNENFNFEDRSYINLVIENIANDKPLPFTLFVCPPVEFGFLNTQFPEDYFTTHLDGSLLSRQIANLKLLFGSLAMIDMEYSLTVVIGDTDENDYIWPVVGIPVALDEATLELKRQRLQSAVFEYLVDNKVVTADVLTVCKLSTLKPAFRAEDSELRFESNGTDAQQVLSLFDSIDIALEVKRMKKLWEPGNYYNGLPIPDDVALEEIVRRKFVSYAEEGLLVLYMRGGDDSILIQAEQPPLLRNRMLSAGRKLFGWKEWPTVIMSPRENGGESSNGRG